MTLHRLEKILEKSWKGLEKNSIRLSGKNAILTRDSSWGTHETREGKPTKNGVEGEGEGIEGGSYEVNRP